MLFSLNILAVGGETTISSVRQGICLHAMVSGGSECQGSLNPADTRLVLLAQDQHHRSVAMVSLDDAEAKELVSPNKKLVRGKIILQCFFFEDLASGGCNLTWVSCTDPGGTQMPRSLSS